MMNTSLRLFDLFLAKAPVSAAKPTVDWLATSSVLILFLILVLLTQFAPTILEFINKHESKLSNKFLDLPIALRSFSSGLAVAYVLIMLIPEYQVFNQKVTYGWINAYKLSLFGLIAYKGIQHYCLLVAKKSSQAMGEWGFVKSRQEEKLLGFRVSTSVFAVYASLILLTLPYQLTYLLGPADKILYLLTFIMHLGFNIFGLFEENERNFKRLVPPVVISVLSASLVLTLFNVLPTALLLGCLSVLAGIILYNVFKNELPSAENSSFAWFAIGISVFVSVDSLTVRNLIH
jgi:hypothetical protein